MAFLKIRPFLPAPLNKRVLHNRGASRHRHLERSCMSVWETDGKRSYDALSREISHPNASWTIEE